MAEISIGQYIFTRLAQLGVKSVFGVPGGTIPIPSVIVYSTRLTLLDYELVILDMIPAAGLKWHGNANELIASYAVCPPHSKELVLPAYM